MIFRWLVGISALIIAGCAAYFSITGIALLFSGATLGVAIMASSLEAGKLVAASYLHRKWDSLILPFKIYFTSAVLILIFITSMGIFGFLSNAYQKTALSVQSVESEIELLVSKKSSIESQMERIDSRIQTLNNQRLSQEVRYDSLIAGENWVNARRAFELIESADIEIQESNAILNSLQGEVFSIDEQILTIQTQNIDIAREIGGFKFIAEAFNVSVDDAVKWFIIMLIFVFDPLAVSLVIAYNSLREPKAMTEKEKVQSDIENDISKMAEEYKKKIIKEKSSKEHSANLQPTTDTPITNASDVSGSTSIAPVDDVSTRVNDGSELRKSNISVKSDAVTPPSTDNKPRKKFGMVSDRSQNKPNTKKPYL